MIDEFERLFKGFIFVYLLDDPEITSETFQIYAVNVPAKESSHNFIYYVKIILSKINRNQRKSIYFQRHINGVCIIIDNGHLITEIPVLFLINNRKNKKLYVFSRVTYSNVHTIKMVYSVILDLLFAMMFHKKFILTDFRGSEF